MARVKAEQFQGHVFANGVNEPGKAFRIVKAVLLAQGDQHAEKRLLGDVFDQLRRAYFPPQFQADQFPKMTREVAFGSRVAAAQPIQVIPIKALAFQSAMSEE